MVQGRMSWSGPDGESSGGLAKNMESGVTSHGGKSHGGTSYEGTSHGGTSNVGT